MKTTRRFNKKESFESLYLRESTAKRVDLNAYAHHLTDPSYKKIIQYVAKGFYRKAQKLCNFLDLEYDDIHSLASTFGLYYLGLPKKEENNNVIMMKFIDQRLYYVIMTFKSKYNTADTIQVSMDMDTDRDLKMSTKSYEDLVEERSVDNEIERLENEVQALQQQKNTGTQTKIRRKKKQIRILKQSDALKKLDLTGFRKKINLEPEKYSKILTYYAISKHVGHEVRRAAKSMCRKNRIDWKSIAREHFLGKENDSHYDVPHAKD